MKTCYRKEDNTTQQMHSNQQIITWQSPPLDHLKCNIDASLFAQDGNFRLGCFLCDANGFSVSNVKDQQRNSPSRRGRSNSLLQGLIWLRDEGYRNVDIKVDCKMVDDALTCDMCNISNFKAVISTCKKLLQSIPSFKISLIRRQANQIVFGITCPYLYKCVTTLNN